MELLKRGLYADFWKRKQKSYKLTVPNDRGHQRYDEFDLANEIGSTFVCSRLAATSTLLYSRSGERQEDFQIIFELIEPECIEFIKYKLNRRLGDLRFQIQPKPFLREVFYLLSIEHLTAFWNFKAAVAWKIWERIDQYTITLTPEDKQYLLSVDLPTTPAVTQIDWSENASIDKSLWSVVGDDDSSDSEDNVE